MGVIIFRRGAARTAREIRVLNEKVANKQNSREFRQKPAAAEDGQGGRGGGRDRRMESSEHGRAWPHRLLSYQKPHYRCNYRAKNITRDGGWRVRAHSISLVRTAIPPLRTSKYHGGDRGWMEEKSFRIFPGLRDARFRKCAIPEQPIRYFIRSSLEKKSSRVILLYAFIPSLNGILFNQPRR